MKLSRFLYLPLKGIVWLVFPKFKAYEIQNMPNEPVIICANHTQMNGPVACELHLPFQRYTWCESEIMHLKEAPSYAFQDFWSIKPKCMHWFYRILSYMIAPLAWVIFNNANTIPVYRDQRVLSTFRETMKHLNEGASIVIFPEHDPKANHILYSFQDGFVDIARLYYKKTGIKLKFVPMYIAPKMKGMYFGKPIEYSCENDPAEERARISKYLFDAITDIAVSLPEHTVVPYRKIPGEKYPINRQKI
ncbi:MAG: 1-acyl-sn-glycerol-3-phosphate acyltransferase [Clostridia bacterium]|nr:1-acyl-sn-glycerol-3-phosphate acyltransferase [Clostridia bacterium]MBQ4157546.1 1-acyl-sn-glycerol-3-phosphate acyltransferase [Clostridia bacterium]